MRPVYRITSQKYHNQDSSNLTPISRCEIIVYPTQELKQTTKIDPQLSGIYWRLCRIASKVFK